MTANVVVPVCVGVAPDVDKGGFLWGLQAGTLVDSPSIIWLIKTAQQIIVVDAGSGTPEWVTEHHRRFTRTPEQEPRVALQRVGVDPGEVRTVVMTHLHYDHVHNLDLFPNARIIVNHTELSAAIAPFDAHEEIYEAPRLGYTPAWLAHVPKMVWVEGDYPVAPGVTMFELPGHSLGHCGVLVKTAAEDVVIVGDHCSLFENWSAPGTGRHIPSRTYVDLRQYYASFARLESIGGRILPGHEMRVFDQDSYP